MAVSRVSYFLHIKNKPFIKASIKTGWQLMHGYMQKTKAKAKKHWGLFCTGNSLI
jgi:hypothetical protein